MAQPLIRRVTDKDTHQNFEEIARHLREADHNLRGVMTNQVALVTGDNSLDLPGTIKNVVGRHTIYLDAAVTLFDRGITNGKWVVNSSGPANARFIFF